MNRRGRLYIVVDVNFWESPQIAVAGEAAGVQYLKLLCYCRRHSTGGTVPLSIARTYGQSLPQLADVGLIESNCDSVEILDWTKWNESADEAKAQRENAKERMRKLRLKRKEYTEEEEEEEERTLRNSCATVAQQFAQQFAQQADDIYSAYPKKVGRRAAVQAIRSAIKRHGFQHVLEKTQLFASVCNKPKKYIPNPATFYNQERYNDDPDTWTDQPEARNGRAHVGPGQRYQG